MVNFLTFLSGWSNMMDTFGENKQNKVTYADNDMQTHIVFIWICNRSGHNMNGGCSC